MPWVSEKLRKLKSEAYNINAKHVNEKEEFL